MSAVKKKSRRQEMAELSGELFFRARYGGRGQKRSNKQVMLEAARLLALASGWKPERWDDFVARHPAPKRPRMPRGLTYEQKIDWLNEQAAATLALLDERLKGKTEVPSE